MKVSTDGDYVDVVGNLLVIGPDGPFDVYRISMRANAALPEIEPEVFEIRGRIPRTAERHTFENTGNCCLGGVGGMASHIGRSIIWLSFMDCPVNDFFTSQSYYEVHQNWPCGQRSHGALAMLESYCDVLGTGLDPGVALAHLVLLSRANVKGHVDSPCGSGKRLRYCHSAEMMELRERIGPAMAARMLRRISEEVHRLGRQ